MGSERDWLSELKVGDEVFVSGRFGPPYPVRISRVTKTMIVVERGGRFRRENGRKIGADAWNYGYLIQPTEENRERYTLLVLHKKVVAALERVKIPETKDGLQSLLKSIEPFLKQERE